MIHFGTVPFITFEACLCRFHDDRDYAVSGGSELLWYGTLKIVPFQKLLSPSTKLLSPFA